MSDLIRRMDALQACQVGPSDEWSRSTKSGYNQAATDCAMNILRVPVVQPHVNETPKSEHVPCDVLTPATKGGWQPIETAPKDGVIDLWSQEGGRYPDAVWGVCGDVEGWTDANDNGSLGGGMFTHWRDRPAPPATKGGDA